MALQRGVVLYQARTVDQQMLATLQVGRCNLVRIEASGVDDAGVLTDLAQHGIKSLVLVPLTIVPGATRKDWQAPVHSATFTAYVQQFAEQCALLAAAFPPLYGWEICNEQGSLGSQYRLEPDAYAVLFAAAYRVLHPRSPVGTGGLFAWAPRQYGGDKPSNSEAPYLSAALWNMEILPEPVTPDFCCLHLYLSPGGALNTQVVKDYLADYRKATNLPLVVSEHGWQSGLVGAQTQRDNIIAMHATCAADSQVAAIFYFCLTDFTGTTWGLQAPGALERKIAFAAWKELP